jgi:hypothetical protein
MGLFSIFGRTAPATVPTDRIIPLRYWDDLHYLRSLCHDFTLRFDDVLDACKLETSLARLMEIGDWGQLGARLRLNVGFYQSQRREIETYRILGQWKARIPHSC